MDSESCEILSSQADRMRFRRNLERIGELAAFEISKTLEYEEKRSADAAGYRYL